MRRVQDVLTSDLDSTQKSLLNTYSTLEHNASISRETAAYPWLNKPRYPGMLESVCSCHQGIMRFLSQTRMEYECTRRGKQAMAVSCSCARCYFQLRPRVAGRKAVPSLLAFRECSRQTCSPGFQAQKGRARRRADRWAERPRNGRGLGETMLLIGEGASWAHSAANRTDNSILRPQGAS